MPAILNGFPITFDDSAHYLRKPFAVLSEATQGRFSADVQQYRGYVPPQFGGDGAGAAASPGEAAPAQAGADSSSARLSDNPFFLRPAAYSIALLPFALPATLPVLPLAQALLVLLLCNALLRALVGPAPPLGAFVAVYLALLASAAPWLVSQIMPDVLTGCLALWIALVVCGAGPLRGWLVPGMLVALGTFLIASHLTHLPLTIAVAAAGLGLRGLAGRQEWPALRRRAATVLLAVMLAAAGLVGTNLAFTGRATLSESSPLFLLARLVGDGTAGRVLAEDCPAGATWLLCRHPELWNVSNDWFLWGGTPAWLEYWGERERFLREASDIAAKTLERYPLEQLERSLSNSYRQLVTLDLEPTAAEPPKPGFTDLVRQMGRPAWLLLERSWQAADPDQLDGYRSVQNRLQYLSMPLALGLLVAITMLFRRSLSPHLWSAVGLVPVLLLANAMLAGGLSGVHGRYQGRIAWSVTVLAVVVALAAAGAWRSGETRDRPERRA